MAPVTFVGAGARVSIVDGGFPLDGADPLARGMDRLFEIHPSAGNVTFRDLTLREASSPGDGGAIQNWSPGVLRIENAHVLDNLAGGVGGGINNADPEAYDWVVAPLNMPKSGFVEISNSVFSGNGAGGGGAAINNTRQRHRQHLRQPDRRQPGPDDPRPDADRSPIPAPNPSRPELVPAPGVYTPDASAIVNEGQFDLIGTIRIVNSTVARNFSNTDGGGVANPGSGNLTIEGSTFADNHERRLGRRHLRRRRPRDHHRQHHHREHAHDGGGIFNGGAVTASVCAPASSPTRPSPTIDVHQTIGNTALASGGGLFNDGDAIATVSDVIFRGNFAGDEGGGLVNQGRASLDLIRVTFENNQARAKAAAPGSAASG